jgi:carbonyl reductase 1
MAAGAPARAVLVTGANRGLGYTLALSLLREGPFHVLATARGGWDAGAAATAAAALRAAAGRSSGAVTFHALDVADAGSRAALRASVTAALAGGPLHALINNAGVYPSGWTAAAVSTAVGTNTAGPLALAVELADLLPPGGVVVNVSSGYGKRAFVSAAYGAALDAATDVAGVVAAAAFSAADADTPRRSPVPAYCLSKAALNRGTQVLAAEWGAAAAAAGTGAGAGRDGGSRSVRVVAVDPGWCRTDMGGAGAPRPAEAGAAAIRAAMDHPGTGAFLADGGKPTAW